MQGRLVFRNDDEVARARRWGIEDLERVYDLDDMAKGDCIFAATGVTDGSLLKGVHRGRGCTTTDSIVMRASTGTIRRVSTEYRDLKHRGLQTRESPTLTFLGMEVIVRPLNADDRQQWKPLWDGYNLFYERPNLPGEITEAVWTRFLDPGERMYAAVAEIDGRIVGIVHYLYHRSTISLEDVCYLQDLFTSPDARGLGVGRALIEHVYEEAAKAGSRRVYWQTHEANPARKLYDKVADLTPFRRYAKELA